MTLLVGVNHPALLNWATEQISDSEHGAFVPETARCTALLDDEGRPIVVAVFNGWTSNACEGSIASDLTRRWANRRFIQATYAYVFERCGIDRLNMLVATANEPAIRMHEALGHVREGHLRSYFAPGRDAYIYSFLRSDWEASRWYPSRSTRSVNTTDPFKEPVDEQEGTSATART